MDSVSRSIRTKGVRGLFRTGVGLVQRYGLSDSRMRANLLGLRDMLEKFDAVATLPITGRTLERNLPAVQELGGDCIEWALHGYRHVDYGSVPPLTFAEHVRAGTEVFRKAGIRLSGYRAPYLRVTDEQLNLLAKSGFAYDSSRSAVLGHAPEPSRSISTILEYYNTSSSWETRRVGGLVEIPVCLPDDEMLVDRLHLSVDAVGRTWTEMAEIAVRAGHPLVLQLHPVRFPLCGVALEAVLEWGAAKGVPTVQLKDLAAKGPTLGAALAITGDVDEMRLSDFRHVR